MNKKKLLASHSTTGIVALMIGLLIGMFVVPKVYYLELCQQATTSQTVWNADITGMFANGSLMFHDMTHNVYTRIGKTFERDLKAFGNITQSATYGIIRWVSLSNDASPVDTWTQLANEATASGAGRKAFDTFVPLNYTTVNGTVTFTFSAPAITLQCAGIQWNQTASTNNNLYAAFAFTQTTFNADDQLIIRYYNQETGT